MTTSRLRALLKGLVLSIDPAAARRRAETGRDQARVEAWQEHSGNVGLAGRELPAADALAADKRLTAIAQALKDAGAAGTLDQLRAAVFAALLAGRDPGTLLPPAADHGGGAGHGNSVGPGSAGPGDSGGAGPGDSSGAGPGDLGGAGLGGNAAGADGAADSGRGGLGALAGTVHLVMPAAAWLGLSDAPGEAAGLGPLDAWTCRELAARLTAGRSRTRWHVTLTSPDGRAVAHAAARVGPAPPCPGGRPETSGPGPP